jgi:hypothetical protein
MQGQGINPQNGGESDAPFNRMSRSFSGALAILSSRNFSGQKPFGAKAQQPNAVGLSPDKSSDGQGTKNRDWERRRFPSRQR